MLFRSRCTRPLIDESGRLSRAVALHGIQYVICDSVGVAVPGRPEDAEHAAGYARALRQLGPVGSLHLAHVSKGAPDAPDPNKPFGSVFWSNLARSTWFVKRSSDEATGGVLDIGLYHRKSNTSALLPPRGLRLRFGLRVAIDDLDLAGADTSLAAGVPLWRRMRVELLRARLLSRDALARALDVSPDAVRKSLARHADVFVDRDGLVELADRGL